jgi:hypothetical protein
MVNVENTQKLIEFLEANPDMHDQDDFLRKLPDGKIVGCAAGLAAILNGGVPEFSSYQDEGNGMMITMTITSSVFMPDGKREYVDLFAQRWLGLNGQEARALFFGQQLDASYWDAADNSKEHAISYLKRLVAEAS